MGIRILTGSITMDLFETRLTRDWGACVFVERAPVPREIELVVNVEFLVTKEDDTSFCDEKSPGNRKGPLRRCLQARTSSAYNSSFWATVNCLRSIPCSSVPMVGVRSITLEAHDRRFFLVGSAENPRSTTSISSNGPQCISGRNG